MHSHVHGGWPGVGHPLERLLQVGPNRARSAPRHCMPLAICQCLEGGVADVERLVVVGWEWVLVAAGGECVGMLRVCKWVVGRGFAGSGSGEACYIGCV